jgi:2-polyprenyl-3-methyl-5-hydroxy-6-metoxy-1,4-benzoquinol methylase
MSSPQTESSTLYEENASIYAAPPRDATSHFRFSVARPLIMEERPSAVLDIGCGRGEFLGRLPASLRRSGIDSLPPEEVLPGIDYVQSDIAQGLPWDDAQFDAVFAGEIIEHLLDTMAFLEDCRRVLRPMGVLVLTTPNLAYWRNLLQWMRQQQFFFVDYRLGETGHVRYFAPRTLRAVLVEAGFRVEKLFSVGDLPTSRNAVLRGIGDVVGGLFTMRNLSLIAKARWSDHQEVAAGPSSGTVASPYGDKNAPGC